MHVRHKRATPMSGTPTPVPAIAAAASDRRGTRQSAKIPSIRRARTAAGQRLLDARDRAHDTAPLLASPREYRPSRLRMHSLPSFSAGAPTNSARQWLSTMRRSAFGRAALRPGALSRSNIKVQKSSKRLGQSRRRGVTNRIKCSRCYTL